MRTRILPLAAIAALAVTAIACGDEDDPAPSAPSPTVAAQPTAPGNPTPAATAAAPDSTGIASVDAAIAALLAGDVAALRAQAQFQSLACETEPEGIGGPPICDEGEADGTMVTVLPTAQCEGSYVRDDALEAALGRLIDPDVELYAVYRTPAAYYPDGPYSIVLKTTDPLTAGGAREVIVDDSGIVGVNYGCAETPEVLVQNRRLTDAIVAPG